MHKFFYITFPIMIVLLVGQQIFSWHYNKSFSRDEIDSAFESIISKYAVKIEYEINENFFSPIENPPIPAGPGRNSKVTPIRHRELLRYPDLLMNAFNKYPIHVIKKNLKAIHFSSKIQEGELEYGGTYDPFRKVIYLIDDGRLSDDNAIYTFHHEFSSLLLKGYSFYVNPWSDNNPQGFKYLYDKYKTWERLKEVQLSHKEDTDNYVKGFINTYGQTNFENDFNEYSAMIFTYPQKFKEIMNQYPRVKKKFLVWLEFYQRIDPIFTEAYLFGNTS